ncbi:nuclear transport factor 2 family protein [Haliea sp. E17]|uniref:nuclear transport factor 2 family protein n=1 Tax=Haliea sp. E17 TaxID=3401576 RepID=UPI003AAC5A86
MTIEQRKQNAVKMLHASARGDADAVRELINDDFQFRFMQQADSWSADGEEMSAALDKENYLAYGVPVAKQITRDGMHFTEELILADGDYIVVFGHSNAVSLKGQPYNNNYCWRMRFSGDRISELYEYCDTHLAHEVLFG